MRLWHYTIYHTFRKIVESGEIKTHTTARLNEKPVVWLSSNPIWEETVRKAIRNPETEEISMALSRDELFKRDFPAVRIEINTELVVIRSWRNFKKYGGISKKEAKGLEKVAIKWGANPKEWWVSCDNIPLRSCIWPIEIWNEKEWLALQRYLK